jgi:hypothetical protein
MPEKHQFYKDHDQRYQKHKQADAVDAMHITHPFCIRRVGIALFDVQIFTQLFPYTHKTGGCSSTKLANIAHMTR